MSSRRKKLKMTTFKDSPKAEKLSTIELNNMETIPETQEEKNKAMSEIYADQLIDNIINYIKTIDLQLRKEGFITTVELLIERLEESKTK